MTIWPEKNCGALLSMNAVSTIYAPINFYAAPLISSVIIAYAVFFILWSSLMSSFLIFFILPYSLIFFDYILSHIFSSSHSFKSLQCFNLLLGYVLLWWIIWPGPQLEVSTVHGQTVENNGLTAYSSLSWTVNILGRQRLVNT